MAKSKKTTEERMAELDVKLAKIQQQAQKLEDEKKTLKKKQREEEQKKRTKRLIEIGASVESICGLPIEKEELPKLLNFFHNMEYKQNNYFARFMGYDIKTIQEDDKTKFIYSKNNTDIQNQ